MRANSLWLCLILAACVACQFALTKGADVKVFGPLDTGTRQLALCPDGSIWFCCGGPARVFRIRDDEFEQVHFLEGEFVSDSEPFISFAPDGIVWFAQNWGWPYVNARPYFFFACPDRVLHRLDFSPDPVSLCHGIFCDPMSRPYAEIHYHGPYGGGFSFCRLNGGDVLDLFGALGTGHLTDPVFASAHDAWMGAYGPNPQGSEPFQLGLYRISLDSRAVLAHYTAEDGISDENTYPRFIDSEGRLWLWSDGEYMTFDGQSFQSVFPEVEGVELGNNLLAAADHTLWASVSDYGWNIGVARLTSSGWELFNEDDGLPPLAVWPELIDFDGNVWGLAAATYDSGKFVWRLSDGGWPPMRISLAKRETPESISVQAQVINNGPVVGVDVYVALQQNGQRLFWPNWQPEPCPVQVNLRPGHNQTATIISAPRASIPPGNYTVWACMTGRNTQKLIGPIDRKFESLTVEVGDAGK